MRTVTPTSANFARRLLSSRCLTHALYLWRSPGTPSTRSMPTSLGRNHRLNLTSCSLRSLPPGSPLQTPRDSCGRCERGGGSSAGGIATALSWGVCVRALISSFRQTGRRASLCSLVARRALGARGAPRPESVSSQGKRMSVVGGFAFDLAPAPEGAEPSTASEASGARGVGAQLASAAAVTSASWYAVESGTIDDPRKTLAGTRQLAVLVAVSVGAQAIDHCRRLRIPLTYARTRVRTDEPKAVALVATVLITALAGAICVHANFVIRLVCSHAAATAAFFCCAACMGAPVFRRPMDSLGWALACSVLAMAPGTCLLSNDAREWREVYILASRKNPAHAVCTCVSHATVLGAWIGAWVVPLDWGRPWQVRVHLSI